MKIMLEKNGLKKNVKCGFSWTTLFFGGIPQIFRGEYALGLIIFITGILGVQIVYAFFANRVTARILIADGWKPTHPDDAAVQYAMNKWGVAQ